MKCKYSDKCPLATTRDREDWREELAAKHCDNDAEPCIRRQLRDAGLTPVEITGVLHPDGTVHRDQDIYVVMSKNQLPHGN